MKVLDRKGLKGLVEGRKGPCVSIFMLTHCKGPETQQDTIRLKNLIREAEQQLVELEVRPAEARDRLAPAGALLARVGEAFGWQSEDSERAARAVFNVLARRISEGEIQDITGILPQDLRELWPREICL
jgi:hypothetical protein